MLNNFIDRRKRLKRPLPLILFGLIYLSLPVIRYFRICYERNIDYSYLFFFLKHQNPLEYILLLLPIVVAIGILLVKKWGWYLFLIHAVLLISYNLFIFFQESVIYNISAVLQSFFGALAIIFFTSKDISAPYLKMAGRGWRYHLRRPIALKVRIDGKLRNTKDINELGLYVKWKDCSLKIAAEIEIRFSIFNEKYNIKGGVVRLDKDGIGIAFRALSKTQQSALRQTLQKLERETHAS